MGQGVRRQPRPPAPVAARAVDFRAGTRQRETPL